MRSTSIHSAGIALLLWGISSTANAAKLEDVAPYPKAESGFNRQVIQLPKNPRNRTTRSRSLRARP